MSTHAQPLLSPAEYLAMERASRDIKHEFFRGEIFAMAGGSRKHNLLALNLSGMLYNTLRDGPCETYSNDMRVLVHPSGLYTYPDLVVTCEQPRFEDEFGDTLLNPQLIIEVLSDSTESYDRGKKFEHYRRIESLVEYMLVAQDRPQIDLFSRSSDGSWQLTDASGLESAIRLASLEAVLPLAEIYARIEFPAEE